MLAEVILDLPIWGLDRPLTYRVPACLHAAVRPGVLVRVPLRGRRVRGWVVATSEATDVDDGELSEIAGISGPAPVFDEALLAMARVMARRYVHPLQAFLRLVTPPQMGRRMGRRATAEGQVTAPPGDGGGSGSRSLRRLGPREDPVGIYRDLISETLARGHGAVVVVPELREGSVVLEGLQRAFPADAAVVHSAQGPAERSKALWSVALGERRVVLGGRAAVFAPAFGLGLVVVHAESDRTLKEQRSPYYDAREAAEARAASCGASLLLASEGPSLASLHRATTAVPPWSIVEPPRASLRASWPLVELIEPTRSPLPRRAVAALLGASREGSRALVLVPRLQATPSGPGPGEVAAYLRRAVPRARVERADPAALAQPSDLERALQGDIVVATEGALGDVDRPAIATAVALGVDSLIHRPTGRAAEDAFGTLWELACLLARSGPGRLLLETDGPGHHCVQAVVRADYHFFARHEFAARWESDGPPRVTLIRIRMVSGAGQRAAGRPGPSGMGDVLVRRLAGLPATELLGPVEGRLGPEVLLKVNDIEQVLDPLRAVVASATERLLVEMDPREW